MGKKLAVRRAADGRSASGLRRGSPTRTGAEQGAGTSGLSLSALRGFGDDRFAARPFGGSAGEEGKSA